MKGAAFGLRPSYLMLAVRLREEWRVLFGVEGGIIGLMKSAALELGRYKITVNTIEPGLIDTATTRNDKR